MSKFKVGDTVRYNDFCNLGAHKHGMIGKVVGLNDMGSPLVLWENAEKSLHTADYIELIDSQPEQPAIDAHYTKYAIQPMEFSLANGLDAAQHTVIKYTVRYRDKGGIRDLRAAIRVLELMIEREEKAQANG